MKPFSETSFFGRFSVQPVLHRVRKRITPIPSREQACDEMVIVHPEEFRDAASAIYLPNQMARVLRTAEETSPLEEERRIRGGRARDMATVAYRFNSGLMINGVVYVAGYREQQVFEEESLWPKTVLTTIERAGLPSTLTGDRYFGHFISDEAGAAKLAAQFAPAYFAQGPAPRSQHALRYLDIYGIPDFRVRSARFEQLWLFQDLGMNSHKRQRFAQMREQVREAPGLRSGHGVYFRRRGAGQVRHPINESEIEERLSREGFEIIDVTVDSVDTIIKRTRNAAVVVGVEGSALVHGLMCMADKGLLMCLQPPHRFNNVLKFHADAMGMRYAFMVGEAQGRSQAYRINVDDIFRTLELSKLA